MGPHRSRSLAEGYTGPADAVPHKQRGETTQRACSFVRFVPSSVSLITTIACLLPCGKVCSLYPSPSLSRPRIHVCVRDKCVRARARTRDTCIVDQIARERLRSARSLSLLFSRSRSFSSFHRMTSLSSGALDRRKIGV